MDNKYESKYKVGDYVFRVYGNADKEIVLSKIKINSIKLTISSYGTNTEYFTFSVEGGIDESQLHPTIEGALEIVKEHYKKV
jgi:hypothetical protein